MTRTRHGYAMLTGALIWAVVSVATFADATLDLRFEGMNPHIGQPFALRVIEAKSGVELTRLSVSEIPMGDFEIELAGLELGASYRIDFYADVNGNGAYDAPPTDHAWRIEISELQEGSTLEFAHNTDFTDIGWPPRIDGAIEQGEYRHAMTDAETGIEVFWQNDGTMIYVGLISPGTGWAGIGFDPSRRMQGANIVIAAVGADGLAIADHFGTGQTSHSEDASSNIIQAAGAEIDGRTIVEFAYPLDTGNADDKPLLPGSEVAIILAYHATSDSPAARHTERSTSVIRLDE